MYMLQAMGHPRISIYIYTYTLIFRAARRMATLEAEAERLREKCPPGLGGWAHARMGAWRYEYLGSLKLTLAGSRHKKVCVCVYIYIYIYLFIFVDIYAYIYT